MNTLKNSYNSYIVNFLKKYTTMCKSYVGKQCLGCPLYDKAKDEQKCDIYNENTDLEILVSIVNLWDPHPQKTMMQDFFEKFPNAESYDNGMPTSCAKRLGYCQKCKASEMSCFECWNRPMED